MTSDEHQIMKVYILGIDCVAQGIHSWNKLFSWVLHSTLDEATKIKLGFLLNKVLAVLKEHPDYPLLEDLLMKEAWKPQIHEQVEIYDGLQRLGKPG